MAPRVIYWFRTDLRLHDSPAFQAALDLKPECLYPIWTWDPHYVYRARVGPNRWQFLLDCQKDLSESITKLNKKSKLFLIREAPQTLFPKLLKAWKISHLVFEKDVDGYARDRDSKIIKMAKDAGVEVVIRSGRTLWDSDQLVEANGGKPTMSISQVQKAGEKIGAPPRPIPAPKSIPDPGDTSLDFKQEQPSDEPDINSVQRNKPDESYKKLAGPKGDFAVPTMKELGLKPATTPHRGGETLGLQALDQIISNTKYTATFQKPNTAPTDFDPQSTTLLSPHMHFGSVSCREFYWRVEDTCAAYSGTHRQPPVSLRCRLIFRDMYFGAIASIGLKFSQTYGNPQVRFIPWHLPSTIDTNTGLATGSYDVDSAEAHSWFLRWKYGRTGFPWIDAIMRQLRAEGWIHHLARHAVACFLTRGGCYVDWERGADVFEEWLVDHEVACNAGNWQWLSCTAFFAQFYRVYSPVAFPAKTDKTGQFVRRYVPELAAYDAKYIYEPWKAPVADQKKWGCVVAGDGGAADGTLDRGVEAVERDKQGLAVYPKPMFDFQERRRICLDGMKSAYDVGFYGNDQRVKDGTWRKEFADAAEGPTKGKSGPPGAMISGDADADADGTEHYELDGDGEDGGEEDEQKSPKKSQHKRAASKGQTSLDGHVKRTKR